MSRYMYIDTDDSLSLNNFRCGEYKYVDRIYPTFHWIWNKVHYRYR